MVSLTQKAQTRGPGKLSTFRRKAREMQLVNESTISYITGKTPDDVISLQEIKNSLKAEKGNPHSMNMKPGHANAQIRTDMLHLVNKGLRDPEGQLQHVKAKELGNRVIFINAQLARGIIAQQKDKKVQAEMQARLEKVLKLPDRESYGGN